MPSTYKVVNAQISCGKSTQKFQSRNRNSLENRVEQSNKFGKKSVGLSGIETSTFNKYKLWEKFPNGN